MKRKLTYIIFFVTYIFARANSDSLLINLSHLNDLYEEINLNGKHVGIIHIYSEYPDYKWIGDDDEGIACVDDVARASVVYINYSKLFNDIESKQKAKKLIEFILSMQNENGWFYNFIFDKGVINTTHQNSRAEPNWWSWRALWSLTIAYDYFKEDADLSLRISSAIKKTVFAIKNFSIKNKSTILLDGFKRPAWLPYKYAADQSALIILSLVNYYKSFCDTSVIPIIKDYCDGILLMQEGNKNQFPYYAFLSWENSWHGWGNLQSYALLNAYTILNDKNLLLAALNEIDYFYNFLLKEKFISEFRISKNGDEIIVNDIKKFPQIAYMIRPVIYASIKAAEITNQQKYYELACNVLKWFTGYNDANFKMYNPESGLCYDGIIDKDKINKNSGAESTIEALLSLLEIHRYKIHAHIDNSQKYKE
ncbi:hypothetical protein [Rosettibacter firmus]|uniref:hypothetical protein n=1 Tax=Rosettibacter firmus TaxID=3111522 RepID=UPI00336C2C86